MAVARSRPGQGAGDNNEVKILNEEEGRRHNNQKTGVGDNNEVKILNEVSGGRVRGVREGTRRRGREGMVTKAGRWRAREGIVM